MTQTLRVQTLGGTWETLGVDRFPGIWPTDINPTYTDAGPDSLSFSIARPSSIVHTDLLPYTPLEMVAGGQTVWGGYTLQAPPGGTGQTTQVTCLGWQHYLEEDPRPAVYIHRDMSDWVDARTLPDVLLSTHQANAQVEIGGTIRCAFPQGGTFVAGAAAAAVLDLGPNLRARSLGWANETDGATTGATAVVYIMGHDTPFWGTTGNGREDFVAGSAFSASHQFASFDTLSVTNPHRYITVMLWSGAGGTFGAEDCYVRFTRLNIAAIPTYLSSVDPSYSPSTGYSSLHADTVIKDQASKLPLLSTDQSQIASVSFNIPSAYWRDDTTARQIMDAVNDYHGYQLGVDAQKRAFFKPQPATPTLQVRTVDRGVTFQDRSTNDGTELYNHVSVTGQDGSGQNLRVDRYTANYPYLSSTFVDITSASCANPSGDVDASGWTVSTGTSAPVRSTTTFHSSPGSLSTTPAGTLTGTSISYPLTGTFRADVTYRATIWVNDPTSTSHTFKFGVASPSVDSATVAATPPINTWTQYQVTWTPLADTTSAIVLVDHALISGAAWFVDDVFIEEQKQIPAFPVIETDVVPVFGINSNMQQPDNPRAGGGALNWTMTTGNYGGTPSTGVPTFDPGFVEDQSFSFDSGASMHFVHTAGGHPSHVRVNADKFGVSGGQVFKQGQTYRFAVMHSGTGVTLTFGDTGASDSAATAFGATAAGVWQLISVDWTPTGDRTAASTSFSPSVGGNYWLDSPYLQIKRGYGLANPSADVDASNWTGATRTTTAGQFHSTPGAFLLTAGTEAVANMGTFDNTVFKAGVPYVLKFRRMTTVSGGAMQWTFTFGNRPGGDFAQLQRVLTSSAAYTAEEVVWVPRSDTAIANVKFYAIATALGNASVTVAALDTFTMVTRLAHILDRRGRVRTFNLQIPVPTDQDTMDILAKAWLLAHRSMPLKGQLTVTSDDAIVDNRGNPISRDRLGQYAGGMIRLLDVSDPEAAVQARDAIITTVSGMDTVTLDLDNTPKGLDQLIARLGVLQAGRS